MSKSRHTALSVAHPKQGKKPHSLDFPNSPVTERNRASRRKCALGVFLGVILFRTDFMCR